MKNLETHPCSHHNKGKCSAIGNWWNGEPSDCDYTPEQLRLSGEKHCSFYSGEFTETNGTRISPDHLESLGNIARGDIEEIIKMLKSNNST